MKRNIKRTSRVAAFAFVVLSIACGALDVLISACDSGPLIVAQIEVSQATKDRWNYGFLHQAVIFRVYQASDRSKTVQKKAAFDSVENIRANFVHSGNVKADAWIAAIVAMVRNFLHIPAEGAIDTAAIARAIDERDIEITKAQAEEFKKKIKDGPEK